MKRIYYQSRATRMIAGIILMGIGLLPLMLSFYISVLSGEQSFIGFLSSFAAIFLFQNPWASMGIIFLILLFSVPFTAGFLFLKNAKNIIKLEFKVNELLYIPVAPFKSKGDIWASLFGYLISYETILYKDILQVEFIKTPGGVGFKLHTAFGPKILNIVVEKTVAEEIRDFLMKKY